MNQDDSYQAALAYLLELGAISECSVHGYTEGGNQDLNAYWPRAMADRNKGEVGPIPWAAKMSAQKFTDLLQSTYFDNSGDCIGCQQADRD